MQKAHDASYNNYWKNLPNVDTPIIAAQLNRNEQTVDELDNRIITLDTNKANQSDMNNAVQAITYDPIDGSLTISKFGGAVTTYDTDIDKIPTSYNFIDNPNDAHYKNLAVTLADSTVNYTDMTAVVTENDFNTSGTIQYSISTSGIVSFDIVDYSVTDTKMQPNYLADITAQATSASVAASVASSSKVDSEAWAVGTRNGTPVQMGDPTFQNNAKYYAEHGAGSSFSGLADTNFTSLQNGQVAVYDSNTTKWINSAPDFGMSAKIIINADAGSTVSITTPSAETITPTSVISTVWSADVKEYGTYTVTVVTSGITRTESVTVDAVKIYTVTISGSASITFTTGLTSGLTVTVGQTEISAFPATISVAPGDYTISYVYGTQLSLNASWTQAITVSANEQKTINVVLPGDVLAPVDDVQGWLMCAEVYDKNYTTVSQVLADSTTLNTLIASANAVKYMVRSTGFASDICASSTAMTTIGLDNDCSDALLNDDTWCMNIVGSSYAESILNVKVPTMTSNTSPSGVCSASSEYNSQYTAYKAFDNNSSTLWASTVAGADNGYLRYAFAEAKKIRAVKVKTVYSGSLRMKTLSIKASNDNWGSSDTLKELTTLQNQNVEDYVFLVNPVASYIAYGLENLSTYQSDIEIKEVQFYGRIDV